MKVQFENKNKSPVWKKVHENNENWQMAEKKAVCKTGRAHRQKKLLQKPRNSVLAPSSNSALTS